MVGDESLSRRRQLPASVALVSALARSHAAVTVVSIGLSVPASIFICGLRVTVIICALALVTRDGPQLHRFSPRRLGTDGTAGLVVGANATAGRNRLKLNAIARVIRSAHWPIRVDRAVTLEPRSRLRGWAAAVFLRQGSVEADGNGLSSGFNSSRER
jgi:hypothetical protein